MEENNVIEGAVVPASQISLAGVMQIPAVKQVTLLIGVAVAIAAGLAIALWSQSPSYTPLGGDVSGVEAAEIKSALEQAEIAVKINPADGGIMVPTDRLYDARFALGSQNMLPGSAAGMGMLDEKSSFGDSQFLELARYQHAKEIELARTITSLGAVREARVHLNIPKQATFVRDRNSASASIFLKLSSGGLDPDQATAIVNFIASSVPNLQPKHVTLIDQYSRLLSAGERSAVDAQATSEFEFERKLEDNYRSRIEALLTPLVGAGRVRAEVVADVDFTMLEETRESFDPARAVVRSEQINEQKAKAIGIKAFLMKPLTLNRLQWAEIEAMITEDDGAVVTCNFCRRTVTLGADRLRSLL